MIIMSLSGKSSKNRIDVKCEELNYSSSSLNTTPSVCDEPDSVIETASLPVLTPCHIVLDRLSVPDSLRTDLSSENTDDISPVIKGVYSLSGYSAAPKSALSTEVKPEWLERPICSSSPVPPPAPAALRKASPSDVNKVVRKRKQVTPCKRRKRKREEELDATYTPKGERRTKSKPTPRRTVTSTTSPIVSNSRPKGRPRKSSQGCLAPVREKWILNTSTTAKSTSSFTTTIVASSENSTITFASVSPPVIPATTTMEETPTSCKITVISLPMTPDVAARFANAAVTSAVSSTTVSSSSSTVSAPSCSSISSATSTTSATSVRPASPALSTTVCELCGKGVQLPHGAKFTALCSWCENARHPPAPSTSRPATSTTAQPTTTSSTRLTLTTAAQSQSPDSATEPTVSSAPPALETSASAPPQHETVVVRQMDSTASQPQPLLPLLCACCGAQDVSDTPTPLCAACRLPKTAVSTPVVATCSLPYMTNHFLRQAAENAKAQARRIAAENAAAVFSIPGSIQTSCHATTISPPRAERQPAAFYQHPSLRQNLESVAPTRVVSSLQLRPVS